MKKISFFLLSLLFLSNAIGQNFEGKIVYAVTSIDSTSHLKYSEIDQQYFKDGNFKVVYVDSSYKFEWYDKRKNRYISLVRNVDTFKTTAEMLPYKTAIYGFVLQWSLFINSANKYYFKSPGSDTLEWVDGSLNHDSVISIHINKNVTKVLGYSCDELVMVCGKGVKKFYYSPSAFKVNAQQFIKYKSGNWADFLLMTNSLPLMQVEESNKSRIEFIAVEAEKLKLEDAFFKLPEKSILSEDKY